MEAMIQEVTETRPGFKVTHGPLVCTDDIIGQASLSNYYEADPFRLLLAWAQSRGLRLWDLFSQFDKDGSMSLTKDEFKEAMKVRMLSFMYTCAERTLKTKKQRPLPNRNPIT